MQVKSNALTNIDLLAEYLSITPTSEEQEVLGLLINSATSFIENYTRRFFEKKSRVQEVLDEKRGLVLLKALPVSSVASVIDGEGNNLEYRIKSKSAGIVEFTPIVAGSRVEITYTGGYTIDFTPPHDTNSELPFELTNLCNEIASRMFNKRKSQGISSESMEGQNINWEKELTSDMKDVLNRYKIKTYF